MKLQGLHTKRYKMFVLPLFVFLLGILNGCSYHFEFKITGLIDNYDSLNTYRAEVRTAGGHKIDGMQLDITDGNFIIIQFGELNSFPKTMTILENDSVYCWIKIEFDWRKKEGFIYSEETGQKVVLKKHRKEDRSLIFVADGFKFKKRQF